MRLKTPISNDFIARFIAAFLSRDSIIAMSLAELLLYNWTTVLVFITVFLLVLATPRRPTGAPPGPWCLPVVGNLLQLGTSGDIRPAIAKYRRKYGDVFSLYFGRSLVIILSDYKVIKDAFVKHGRTLSDRPHVFLIDDMGHARGLILSKADKSTEIRKFTMTTLKGFGFGKIDMEGRILEEISELIHALEDENDQPIDPKSLLQPSVSNIICSILFGRRYSYDDPSFKGLLVDLEEIFSNFNSVINFLPWLRFLPGDLFNVRRLNKHIDNSKKFYQEIIQNRIDMKVTDINDFVDALIHEMRETGLVTLDELQSVVSDIFAAGTETTTTTLLWAILYLVKNPDAQRKIQAEIDTCVLPGRSVTLADKQHLKYTQASIMEIQRCANLVPFSVPHSPSKETYFHGYTLPTDCMILPNMHSVLYDPVIFKDPDEFRPSRFLDESGNVLEYEEFIPFSIGRRVCLGESVAKLELFLYLTALLQRFTFRAPGNTHAPSVNDIIFGATMAPKPFKILAIRR